MDNFLSDQVINLWRKKYSSRLNQYTKYNPSAQFHHIANMCAPGLSYYYILNFSNFTLDYLHPNVEKVVGVKHSGATMDVLLKTAMPHELEIIAKKEKIIYSFIQSFENHEELLSYKIIYTYKCKRRHGKTQIMMTQSTPISLSEGRVMEHAFVIHSDISHLGNMSTDWVSFVSLNGKKSYLNIKAEHERFDPHLANLEKKPITNELTKREKEIIKLLSQGLSAKAISEKLSISFNTTRTHRKNILTKTNCGNSAELMAKCLAEGVI